MAALFRIRPFLLSRCLSLSLALICELLSFEWSNVTFTSCKTLILGSTSQVSVSLFVVFSWIRFNFPLQFFSSARSSCEISAIPEYIRRRFRSIDCIFWVCVFEINFLGYRLTWRRAGCLGMEEPGQLKRALIDATAGATAGAISRTVTSPLDVIKIRFQVPCLSI